MFAHFGSLSLNIVTGKLTFRDFRLVTKDYAITVLDGSLTFRYWLHPLQSLNIAPVH